jgi:DNA-binding ferritin-like protein
MQKISRNSIFSSNPVTVMVSMDGGSESCALCMQTSALAQDLLNCVTSFHKLHLKVTGLGSYAAHKALGSFYEAIGDHADDLVEHFQGAEEKILELPNTAPAELNTVEEGIDYLRKIKDKVIALQSVMPHSEIVNELDNVKSLIDSTKYKLLFLK